MKQYNYSYFNLRQIADSGQCFRMIPVLSEHDTYDIISCGRFLRISQKDHLIAFDCPEEDLVFWENYFDCSTDYEAFQNSIDEKDSYLLAAAKTGSGIRILKQDLWEMIITFVISQQKTIPKIREAVENLCLRYGTEHDSPYGCYHAFPSPEQLIQASVTDLQDIRLGYRAKYIRQLCEDAVNGLLDLDHLRTLDYTSSMEYLTGFYGIGKKVANCICLFGLHHIDAFPIDTWIEQILMKEYFKKHKRKYSALPKSKLYSAITKDAFGKYHGYAGVMQQYIFYYERFLQSRIQ